MKVFGMASKRHNYDIVQIIQTLLEIIEVIIMQAHTAEHLPKYKKFNWGVIIPRKTGN